MSRPGLEKKHELALLALLGLAVGVPVLLQGPASRLRLPDWFGAAIAITALLAALMVFWRAGAMRLRYVVLFALALALAAALGPFLARIQG